MTKPYAVFDEMTETYQVGMETSKRLYIFLITSSRDEAHGMTYLINQILGLTE